MSSEYVLTCLASACVSIAGDEDNGSMSSTPTHHLSLPLVPAQQEALNLEVKSNNTNGREPTLRERADALSMEAMARAAVEALASRKMMEEALGVGPAAKRFLSEEERYILNAEMPSAHIKIASRGLLMNLSSQTRVDFTNSFISFGISLFSWLSADGRSQIENGSLVVSMEINGVFYQGVLFAQSTASHRTRLS